MENIFICPFCGEIIAEGERYYELNGKRYHADCVNDNLCVIEVLDILGIKREIA